MVTASEANSSEELMFQKILFNRELPILPTGWILPTATYIMTAKNISKPPARSRVPREEWDFFEVPGGEMIACCYWEYARESATIQFLALRHQLQAYAVRSWLAIPRAERLATPWITKEELDDLSQEAGFDWDAHLERYWATVCPFLPICDLVLRRVTVYASPWQELPPELRAKFALLPSETSQLHGLQPSLLRELEMLWDKNRAPLEEVRGLKLPESDEREAEVLYTASGPAVLPSEGKAPPGQVAAAFSVDFENFTDSEIQSEFARWLKQHRPPEWEKPRRILPLQKQKGRKAVEYRVALERLGLMRLLQKYTIPELKHQLPAAWEKYRGKEHRVQRELQASLSFFNRLFPFLPATETPRCSQRYVAA